MSGFLFEEMDEPAPAIKSLGRLPNRALVFDCLDPTSVGKPVQVRYRCPSCETETDWIEAESVYAARFGIICPSCEPQS